MHRLLTPREVAERLRVTDKTVRRWIRSGYLAAQRIGRQWRVREEVLDRFIEGGAHGDEDLEPLSDDDLRAIRRGLEDIKAGRVQSLQQYLREREQ